MSSLTFLLILSILGLVAGATESPKVAASYNCYHPFISLSTGCYYFSGTHNLQTTWYRAAELCRNFGGNLLVINDPEENAVIKQYLATQTMHGWIGGHLLNDGNFYWLPSMERVNYADWYSGQPSNAVPGNPCMYIDKNVNYQWSNLPCTAWNFSFICEARSSTCP